MNTTDTSEKGLEALIQESLINEAKYIRGEPADYNKAHCVDKVQLLRFLRATQPQEIARLEQAYCNLFEDKFLKRLYDQLQAKGIVEILRNGIKAGEVSLSLFYKKPASSLNKTAEQSYASNIFSVTRQLR